MSKTEIEPPKIIKRSDLGPGNAGEYGPSQTEAEVIDDIDEEKYWGPIRPESGCMDDRLEGLRIQLAGNRAVTEVAADYMDRRAEATPLSRALSRKVQQLNMMERLPVFHKGCAALASIKAALEYNAGHSDEVIEATWDKLEQLGAIEFLTQENLRTNIKAGLKSAQDESIWDADADTLLAVAVEAGAKVEDTVGHHHVAANLDVMSELGFDNTAFRNEHQADDEEPLGLLVTTWVGYRNQLAEDGYSDQDAARLLARAILFNVGVQKLINRDGSPLVTVG